MYCILLVFNKESNRIIHKIILEYLHKKADEMCMKRDRLI